ncbi:cytochrome P450 2J2-like [Branchiostoma floridae]|uniref:Cytochrome P450 2J2-like n=1 Tax=Branchiostoma floridae TaxID=7739 RepID=A0A9J7MWP7_BRAFL|nr:cytochrome P450 2J2-like [Branchiostoma floridae]
MSSALPTLYDMADLWARIQAQKASLLRDLEPKHLLNELLQHGVLDDDEHERVKRAGVTRKDRTEALLDVLKGKEVEELAAFMQLLDRLYPHLAEQIRTAEKEKVEKVIPTPRNCRFESSTRDSLTVAWDQIEAVPGGSVEVAIFAHGNDQEPVQRREVGCDQTDVRMGGLGAGTKYDARVRVGVGELRGKEVTIEAKTESFWSYVSWKPLVIACVVLVIAILLQMALVKSTDRRCLYPKDIMDTTVQNRPNLFGREEDIANLTTVLENKGRVPVLGHLLALGRAPHLQLTVWRRQYGDVFTVRMGMEDVVVLNGYTAVKDALVDRSELFASRPQNYLLDTIVGCGKDIMSARWGTAVKQRRRFSITALKSLGMKIGTGSIEEKIKEEASYLRNKIVEYDGQAFDISNDVNVAVANIICSMVFGKRYDYGDKTFRELSESVSNVIAAMQGQIVTVFPLLRFVPGVNRSSMKALKLNSKIKALLWDEIAHHRENLDRENPRDFIDLLLLQLEQHEKVDNLTEENVMHITHNIFFAGMETTTNTLLWSLLYMTLNPGVQKKVQQELDAVIGESLPALSHRPQLPYVNACLQEVMRIRTLLPLNVPHATTQEVKVQGFDIPKGIKVQVQIY